MDNTVSKKKIIIIIIITGLLFTLAFGSYTIYQIFQHVPFLFLDDYRENPPMGEFESKVGNFKIDYPLVLNTYDLPEGAHGDLDIVATMSNGLEYNIIYFYKHKFVDVNLDKVLIWGKEKAQYQGEKQETSLTQYSSQSYSGILREYIIDFTNTFHSRHDKCIDWYVMDGDYGYDFSFCVNIKYWDKTKDVFMKMINSIEFT